MTYQEIKKNEEVRAYLKKGNDNLGVLGYTDHSEVHCTVVAERAGLILKKLEYPEETIELAKIAGFMHDIGNAVNRSRHAEYGAILANELLKGKDLSLEDRITIMSAIGKTDVRRNRVRDKDRAAFDIHDRVNYAVTEAKLKINKEKKLISLNLQIDESICTMYEYFDIFLGRMMMCRGAAEILDMKFRLTANGSKVL